MLVEVAGADRRLCFGPDGFEEDEPEVRLKVVFEIG